MWVDWEDIPPTSEWWSDIVAGIEGSDAVLFVLTPNSAASDVCGREVAEAAALRKRIVPVLLRDVDGVAVPDPVASVNWLRFPADGDFAAGVERVVEALELDLEWRRAHTRWLVAALEWERKGRDASLLPRGSELEAAEGFLAAPDAAARDPAPTPLQYDFVFAARRAATRRQRAIVASVSVALAVAVALALLALWQRNTAVSQRHLALSRGLLEAASGEAGRRIDRGILLTLESYRRKATPEARSELVAVAQRAEHLSRVVGGFAATPRRVALGRELAVATDVGVARRSLETGEAAGPALRGAGRAPAAVSDDAAVAAVPTSSGLVLRRVSSGALLARLPERDDPVAVRVRGGEALVVTRHGRVSLWSLADGSLVGSAQPSGTVAAADIAERTVALAGTDGLVLVRDRPPFGAPRVLDPTPQRDVSLGGRLAAAVSVGGDVALWDVAGGRRAAAAVTGGDATEVALSADGRWLAVGDERGEVTVSQPAGGGEPVILRGHADAVVDVAFDTSGRLLVSAALDGTVDVWTPRGSPYAHPLSAGGDPVLDVAFSPRGELASSGFGSAVSLWKGGRRRTIGGAGPPFTRTRIAFLGDGSLVTAAPDRVAVGSRVLALDPDAGSALAAAPDVPLVAWASGRRLVTFDVAAGRRLVLPLRAREIADLALSPRPSLLAAATDRGVELLDPATGRRRGAPLTGARGAAVAFGGRLLAAASQSAVVLWDVRAKRMRAVLEAPNTADVALDPAGETAAVSADDGTVRLWDVRARRPLGSAFGSGPSVAFAPDGKWLAVGGDAGVTLWDSALWNDPGALTRLLCRRAGRSMTRSEWHQFLPGESYRATC